MGIFAVYANSYLHFLPNSSSGKRATGGMPDANIPPEY
jgi:hypothetical protein